MRGADPITVSGPSGEIRVSVSPSDNSMLPGRAPADGNAARFVKAVEGAAELGIVDRRQGLEIGLAHAADERARRLALRRHHYPLLDIGNGAGDPRRCLERRAAA